MMTERSKNFMDIVWSIRNSNPDMTEEQLLSAVSNKPLHKLTTHPLESHQRVL